MSSELIDELRHELLELGAGCGRCRRSWSATGMKPDRRSPVATMSPICGPARDELRERGCFFSGPIVRSATSSFRDLI